jgi:hypothetical protein
MTPGMPTTVRELIEILSALPQDYAVRIYDVDRMEYYYLDSCRVVTDAVTLRKVWNDSNPCGDPAFPDGSSELPFVVLNDYPEGG